MQWPKLLQISRTDRDVRTALVVMGTEHWGNQEQLLSFLELFPWPITQGEKQRDLV